MRTPHVTDGGERGDARSVRVRKHNIVPSMLLLDKSASVSTWPLFVVVGGGVDDTRDRPQYTPP